MPGCVGGGGGVWMCVWEDKLRSAAQARGKVFQWKQKEKEASVKGNYFAEWTVGQRWASTLANRSRSNTRPEVGRSEKSYFFEKPKAKIVPSTAIVVDPDVEGWTFTLFVKKTLCLLPLPYQRSKVVSINLPILHFLKTKAVSWTCWVEGRVYVEGRRSSFCPPLPWGRGVGRG
jgi:hypothetical protein